MGKIICLMGKSAAGKDTLYKRLLEDELLGLKAVIPYTTRPIREGEREGVEYFFTDEAFFRQMSDRGKIIEDRAYHTSQGLWRYFTADDGQMSDREQNYIVIGTLEAYSRLQDYFGRDRLIPVMIELEDGVRLHRALERERSRKNPGYQEMCRRFLADCEDFSEEKIAEAGVSKRFFNNNRDSCLEEIRSCIREAMEAGKSVGSGE